MPAWLRPTSEVRHVDRLVAMKVNSSTAPGGTTVPLATQGGHRTLDRVYWNLYTRNPEHLFVVWLRKIEVF